MLINAAQVEEKRTPLQLNMDELAKKLSILSFGVIGVICIIGVLQSRSWLDMFTIGGMHSCGLPVYPPVSYKIVARQNLRLHLASTHKGNHLD